MSDQELALYVVREIHPDRTCWIDIQPGNRSREEVLAEALTELALGDSPGYDVYRISYLTPEQLKRLQAGFIFTDDNAEEPESLRNTLADIVEALLDNKDIMLLPDKAQQ